jgi:hypothetical protein
VASGARSLAAGRLLACGAGIPPRDGTNQRCPNGRPESRDTSRRPASDSGGSSTRHGGGGRPEDSGSTLAEIREEGSGGGRRWLEELACAVLLRTRALLTCTRRRSQGRWHEASRFPSLALGLGLEMGDGDGGGTCLTCGVVRPLSTAVCQKARTRGPGAQSSPENLLSSITSLPSSSMVASRRAGTRASSLCVCVGTRWLSTNEFFHDAHPTVEYCSSSQHILTQIILGPCSPL